MQTLFEANTSDDLLIRLEALAERLAAEIDVGEGHGLGVLVREYRQTVEAIDAIKNRNKEPEGIDDLIQRKSGPNLRRLSVV